LDFAPWHAFFSFYLLYQLTVKCYFETNQQIICDYRTLVQIFQNLGWRRCLFLRTSHLVRREKAVDIVQERYKISPSFSIYNSHRILWFGSSNIVNDIHLNFDSSRLDCSRSIWKLFSSICSCVLQMSHFLNTRQQLKETFCTNCKPWAYYNKVN
jgi:hypothetical protein